MNPLIKIMMRINVLLYRLSGGGLGSRMGGQDVLLLQHVGRKTGQAYTTPTNYYRDGENYVLVGSNWGKEQQPAWYHNLMAHAQTLIQVKGRLIPVTARPASPEEYERLWGELTSRNPRYLNYQSKISRKIPLVILEPDRG